MIDRRKKRGLATEQRSRGKAADSEREQRGGVDRGAMFPVPASREAMSAGYAPWLADLKLRIGQERLQVVLASNTAMVLLYWDIGSRILKKQSDQGWGSRVIDRLAADLRTAFPEMKGFSTAKSEIHASAFGCVA